MGRKAPGPGSDEGAGRSGDLPGLPLVQRGPVRCAEAVAVRLAQVDRDRAAPPLPAVRSLRDLLEDPGVGEYSQVVAGGAGVLARRRPGEGYWAREARACPLP